MADLESNEPAPEPVAQEAPPVETPPAAPADPVEATAVEMQGGKYVPLSAVLAEREKAKAYKDKAEQYDQTIGYVNQVRPYIDFLQANPDLMTRASHTAPTPAAAAQPVDEQAEELARTLDLYTADGQPDIKRAQKIRTMVTTTAEAEAERRVKPLQDSTLRERSNNNYARALVTKSPDGRAPDKRMLDALWANTDPRITATEEGASALVATALGLSLLQGGAAAPPTAPVTSPVQTERPGSRNPNTPTLTALDEKIAGMRGRTNDDWAKLTRSFNPGRPSVLEE